MGDLDGFVVGVTAGRKAEEQADLLRRRGATVILAPVMATEVLASDESVVEATRAAIALQPQFVALLTGIGLRKWMEGARDWHLDEELLATLRSATLLVRGPKAAAAARAAGLEPAFVAKSERAQELVERLREDARPGDAVVVQRHGGEDAGFGDLEREGVRVLEVPVYRWRLPPDLSAVERLIDEVVAESVAAVTFTSAPAVENFFLVADELGKTTDVLDRFNRSVVLACVGPVCAEGARLRGVRSPVYPEVGRLGLMIRALGERLSS